MDALYKWWFIFWISIVACAGAAYLGLLTKLLRADVTYLGACTILLYFIVSGYVGTLTRKLTRERCDIQQIETDIKPCWFASDTMLSFGMIGTVIGFLVMLHAFNINVDPGNVEASRKLITHAVAGLSTSAVTTVVGLICSQLCKLQLVNLEKAIDEARSEV